jgi:hypothetical protein
MALSAITLTPYSVGSAIDQKTIEYIFLATVGAGNYQLGGIPLNFAGYVSAPGASAFSYPLEVRIQSQANPPSTATYKYNPLGQSVANITNLALTSNVVTITAHNTFSAGTVLTLAGLTTNTFLNGQTVTVISTGLSGTAFEFNFTHANVSSGAETGTATVSGQQPNQNSGTFQVYSGTTEQSAGATPASVTGDTIVVFARFRRG